MSTIQTLPLEDIMGERFGRYSKYIIQERALPDIRDGLKPVQRRILYSMNRDGNTFDKGYRKSAKSVGNVMGNFHPHGDSSIYDAMIRLSQDWKMGEMLIEMHGNNGSMDGDPPAAMRYTEARLSEISSFLLKDIEKETVNFAWNFDDTEKEPTVLPASFPNLLVNGSTGISAGYATDIPPHNLSEVIDATIYLIDHPESNVEKVMKFLPGPDFPTGAIIQGREGIKKAYETGKGKVVVRSKAEIEDLKAGRQQIVISEIPYEVNKLSLQKRIDDIVINSKVPGIADARDESDREGLRMVVELKKDADAQLVLNYLYKNTDLQINYNFNMVAIDNMTPCQVGLLQMLSSFIEHRREVIVKRSQFDLSKAKTRLHLVQGLIRMVSILDEVVTLIRASENKSDAKENLKVSYDFTEEQAEAIVTLQLYRLTNTDIVTLENEEASLNEEILTLKAVINDKTTLFNLMKRELREMKKKFGKVRRTELQEEIESIEIEAQDLIVEEETVISVTEAGYIKKTSPRSFASSETSEVGKREEDRLIFIEANALTTQHLLMFTNLGNVIYRPVHELADIRWKDIGEHLSQSLTNFVSHEKIIYVDLLNNLEEEKYYALVTRKGQIKRVGLSEFKAWRTYRSKSMSYVKLKKEDDAVIALFDNINEETELMIISEKSYALKFKLSEVPILGKVAAGVKAVNLKDDDVIKAAFQTTYPLVYLLTQRGAIKVFKHEEIALGSRAKRGLQLLTLLKTMPHTVFAAGPIKSERITVNKEELDLFTEVVEESDEEKQILEVLSRDNECYEVDLLKLPISNRTSNGKFISEDKIEVKSARIN
ncbi:MAG: DNA topoisomerase IV subunit A [Lactovum sp.]